MRKTTIGVGILAVAASLSYGCGRAAHPSHLPDELGNAAPIKQVATEAHAGDIGLEPYDAVDHLYRNAKSQLPDGGSTRDPRYGGLVGDLEAHRRKRVAGAGSQRGLFARDAARRRHGPGAVHGLSDQHRHGFQRQRQAHLRRRSRTASWIALRMLERSGVAGGRDSRSAHRPSSDVPRAPGAQRL